MMRTEMLLMKRIIALLLTVLLCLSLCACGKVSYNDDSSSLYYNGRTYINYNNHNCKYRTNVENIGWKKIAWQPYGFFFILGAVTEFYGNDVNNPDFIANSRTVDLYVREDITLDHNTRLCVSDCSEPYSFVFSEVTTGKVIAFDLEQKDAYTEICNFFVTLEEYPLIEQWFTVWQIGDNIYIQDNWDSDFYEITDGFMEDIYRFGLDSFDYS